MESQEFIVLYTHQKTKKAKVWHDGTLKLGPSGNKAVLQDDKGACLESLFLKCLEVKPGDDLESDRYLIAVEEVKVAGSPATKQEVVREAPGWSSRSSAGLSRGCQPSGLKRKFTGFQGPRQVPKKMVVMENGDSSASFEAGTTFFSPFYSIPPLFPTVGRKEINNTQTAPDSTVAAQTGASWGPCPPTSSEPSPAVLDEEDPSCTPLGPGRRRADPVLATEPTRGHSSAAHCSRGSRQHIRSQAQILALLKSTPAVMGEHRDAEPAGCCGQLQAPAARRAGLEGHTEVMGTERPHSQRQLEDAAGGRSRWAVYLSPQGSLAASAKSVDDVERQAAVQENDVYLNLEDLLERKRMQAFGTCAEKGKKHHEDEPGDSSECWHQEEKLEMPSFCGSSHLLVSCSSAGQGGLLSEADIGGNHKAPFGGKDQGYMGEAVLAVSACGALGQNCQRAARSPTALGHQQAESSLSQDSRTPDDIADTVSESDAASESLDGVQESEGNETQPFLEVTFNLSNFETSDTEEESQESSSLSQNAGSWVKGILGDGSSCVQKPHEGSSCQEISSEHLPCLTSVGDKWTEKCPVKETLSQFCDKTCVGVDPGPCEGGNTGEEEDSDPVSSPDPSAAGSADGCVDNAEDAHRDTEVYVPEHDNLERGRSLSRDHIEIEAAGNSSRSWSNPRNSSELSGVVNNISLLKSLSEHRTALESVEMLKRGNAAFPQQGAPQVEESESRTEGETSFKAVIPKQIKTCDPKVASPEQRISTLSPVSTFSLDSRHKDVMVEFSEESPRARTLPGMKRFSSLGNKNLQRLQLEISGSELCFPSARKLKFAVLPQRRTRVPAVFQSPAHYRQTFTACIIEHLNILLFGLAQQLHRALSKVDTAFYTSSKGEKMKNTESSLPCCHHRQPATLVMAKKEGPNKGRLFYACDRPKAEQCKFFKWLEEVTPGGAAPEASPPSVVLSDMKSLGLYLRGQKIPLYEECQLLVRKGFDFQRKRYGKLKKFTTINPECYSEPKSKLYLKLSRKESSSIYSKDDLWVISKTLDFELDTFIACSAFFGPSSANEVELLPLKGYFPSRWPANVVVHALLVCNASSELTTLKNIQDHIHPGTLPLMPHLLAMSEAPTVHDKRVNERRFTPPAFVSTCVDWEREWPGWGVALQLVGELVQAHGLNEDQAVALSQVARMLTAPGSANSAPGLPITLIHGVFGAGKSYLLAVVVLFFVHLFEQSNAPAVGNTRPWKLLISSSTNVAVDRVLLGLLSLGFENFVRVGSVRKIAKPILPYSLHAGSENENEQLKELQALMKEDLTPAERVCVRRSIEQHKQGTTRTLLRQVLVVGVTCAACPFPCMSGLKFPVVVLDECSQMTEPTSLLPIARFECEKLILVGDPKQLPPTIQGSEAAHENGLEQTLFDRLCLMGHKPVPLRTQYRCHPAISAVASDLFYGGNLRDGVSEVERGPLLHWLPTLCFYNVMGQEQIERDNSFHNVAEASFTLKLIQSLIASGIAGSMIGVITLYKSQMYKLCHSLSAGDFGHPDLKTVQVSTVDAFQGAEKEIVILSCVRTRHVGFIDSETRVNVALTRGRRHLLIVGSLACLRRNGLWGRVIQHCEGREDGLQQASQCEPQLNRILKDYFEKQAEEKQKKKNEKEKSHSQSDMD
ncbi:LOW QUALITY PROTEIN: 5'-3' DNA helicase ZGRF1 [Erethizon dorsatum]